MLQHKTITDTLLSQLEECGDVSEAVTEVRDNLKTLYNDYEGLFRCNLKQ